MARHEHHERLELAERAAKLRALALTYAEIGAILGVSHGTANYRVIDAQAFGLIYCGCGHGGVDYRCYRCTGLRCRSVDDGPAGAGTAE